MKGGADSSTDRRRSGTATRRRLQRYLKSILGQIKKIQRKLFIVGL